MGAPANSPCDTCDARCCAAYAVHVTGEDVRRLSEGAGVPPRSFVALEAQGVRTGAGFVLAPGGASFELVLRGQSPTGRRPPCPFLRAGDGAPPRCGVYRFRPRACRRFPAARLERGWGVREGVVCPAGSWAGHDLARLSWRVALEREAREAETYAAVVAVWNARVERGSAHAAPTLLAYLDWLGDAYRWLAGWRSALRPADRTGAAFLARIRETLAACAPG